VDAEVDRQLDQFVTERIRARNGKGVSSVPV
jgi:hypothetical protein